MDLTSVSCNNCGAALQVEESARFVTCRYCGAQLEVKRNESTISTETLSRIDKTTTSMAEDLGAIRRETEIERLDREWSLRREGLMVRTNKGQNSTPTTAAGITVMCIMGGFGLVWTIIAIAMSIGANAAGAPGIFKFVSCIFPLFGIGFITAAVLMGAKIMTAAKTYSAEEAQYMSKRDALLNATAAATSRNHPPA